MNKKTKTIIWIVVAIVAVVLVGILLSDVVNAAVELAFMGEGSFIEKIVRGEINEIYVDAYNWTGYFVDASGKRVATYKTIAPSIYNFDSFYVFMENLKAANGGSLPAFTANFADPNAGSIWSSLFPILGVVVVALLFWLIMRGAAGAGNP
ncbi:MAG: hypothetical protein IKZ28_03030, partial [Clostridia bacterium]|nr:hypothetical protein [Clostridia bacterium]